MIEFYTGYGKGVPSTLIIGIPVSYPTDPNPMQNDVNALYQGTTVRAISDQTPSLHKESESLKEQSKHRSCSCNVVH